MFFKKSSLGFILLATALFANAAIDPNTDIKGKNFNKIMIVVFENMSYDEIRNEPVFHQLLKYSGNTILADGAVHKSLPLITKPNGNGYAFFSNYYNNHNGGEVPSRSSQPNYIAMTSGSVQNIFDNLNHDLPVDNLGLELIDSKVSWKVYADDLPDPVTLLQLFKPIPEFHPNPNLSEEENSTLQEEFIEQYNQEKTAYYSHQFGEGFDQNTGCYISNYSKKLDDSINRDGYVRKHEPFISYDNIRNDKNYCRYMVNSKHLSEDLNSIKFPKVAFYIPNQINDGHNGTFEERTRNANLFLSSMMGMDPKTGQLLPNAIQAPFQKFMQEDGLLVITFDEPSLTGNPDNSMYTILAGNMINSGSYSPECYPSEQKNADINGFYPTNRCNHYNLLKMIESNWNLRGLNPRNTSNGYKNAYPLDQVTKGLWN